jgi:uncharacterized low-complexity protein
MARHPSNSHEHEENQSMQKKTFKTVLGAAVVTSLSGVAHAAESPFAVNDLASGYLQVAEAGAEAAKEQKEMVCGEGKCGGAMMKAPAMNCGAMMQEAKKKEEEAKKAMEGKCAGMKMDQPAAAPAAPAVEPPKAP